MWLNSDEKNMKKYEIEKFYIHNKDSLVIDKNVLSEFLEVLDSSYENLKQYSEFFNDVSNRLSDFKDNDLNKGVKEAFLLGQYQILKNIVFLVLDAKIDEYRNIEAKSGKLSELIYVIGERKVISNSELAKSVNGTLSSLSNLMSRNHYYFKYIQKQHLFNDSKTYYYSLTKEGERVYLELVSERKRINNFIKGFAKYYEGVSRSYSIFYSEPEINTMMVKKPDVNSISFVKIK